ncbi:hypothetical protein Q1695_002787 [Nippostrongylus brasiliensis]|nr:hypothetical protein Q1695_002787 [Nippostrongylus brasiliensis]
MIRGIRSVGSSEEETQVIRFLSPLTIISGPNGSGKTTLIEALNYITTGALPSGKLASFVHSVEASLKPRVDGMVKLQFTDIRGRVCVATKRVNAALSKAGKLQCKSDEFNIQITSKDGQVHSLSSKVADFQKEIVNLLGVPSAILDNVIFCHQEESTWPLSEPKELKLRFDRIFRLTRFVKALDVMKKMKRDYESQLAAIVEKQTNKEMILKSKMKYVHQRDSCTEVKNESLEKVRQLNDKIKSCEQIIEQANKKLIEMEEIERKAEVKRAELRMLKEQLMSIKVSPYAGTEEELRREIDEIDSSTEFQHLEAKRERIRANVEMILKDVAKMVKKKEEAESEMRKAVSMKMVYNELQNDIRDSELELGTAYGLRGPDYVTELRERIAEEENELRNLKSASSTEHEKAQSRLDAAQMELTKWNCELNTASSRIQQRREELEAEERKLKKAQLSQKEMAELSQEIAAVEESLSGLPEMNADRVNAIRSERQKLQKEADVLRERCSEAEQYEDLERDIEKKSAQRDKLREELDGLLVNHEDVLSTVFGKVSKGPWSAAVNEKLKSAEDSSHSVEKELKICERDHDRANQGLQQAIQSEQQLVSEVDDLRKKAVESCGCSVNDIQDNLSETRLLLSKSRKELASLRTKSTLYETWSEEVTKRSCCPLCERKFANKAGAIDLSAKLMDMSMSVPDELDRLEQLVQETEEKERRLVTGQNYMDQSRKIMDEKVKFVRKEVSRYSTEEAALTEKLEKLKSRYTEESALYKSLLRVKADISLMDSLLAQVCSLDDELEVLRAHLGDNQLDVPLSVMKLELGEKEDRISTLTAEFENMQMNMTEKNQLTHKLHELKERRISLGEIAAQFEHIRRVASQCRAEIDNLSTSRDRILQEEIPKAREELRRAKEARDNAERSAKQQEEVKLTLIREMRNHCNGLALLIEKLNKTSLTNITEKIDMLASQIAECDASVIEFERRKAGLEISLNDLEGSHTKRRTLEDQLVRLLVVSKIATVEKELSEMARPTEKKEAIYRQRDKAMKERDESGLEKARLTGQLEEVGKKISEAITALETKEMKQAERLYHEVVVNKIVTQEAIADLEKYMQCLDNFIIQFHSDKMIAINRILDELWRKVYAGSDIQTISIKSECASTSDKRKVYDYRVVMVIKNGVELDMRDRCSAGQKMLACILVRIALADVFGGACSIIALDEPTTNLDALKVDHMAAMLNNLIAVRRRGDRNKQFQIIVITHDDHLVGKLMLGSKPDFIYVLGKDSYGVSHIKRQYSDGRYEEAGYTDD